MARDIGQSFYKELVLPRAVRNNSSSIDLPGEFGETSSLILQVKVHALTGTTPSVLVRLQDSLNGVDFDPIVSTTAQTVAGSTTLRVSATTPFGDKLRLTWQLAGTTPTADFEVWLAAQMPFT